MIVLMSKRTFRYFSKNLLLAVGLVLVWRGIWYILDAFDLWLFQGAHVWTALVGVALGLVILYLPDKDLKEIEKL
jgi:uncharacterized protein YjeT (DUF2065 family)